MNHSRTVATLLLVAITVVWLTSTASAQSDSTPEAQEAGSACSDGQLRVGDLQLLDDEWAVQREHLDARAASWESDAFLTSLRVNCGILEPGFRWQGTYYSPSAQAFYTTDTGNTVGAEFDPDEASELPNNLKFGAVWRALTKAGYDNTITLDPATGITVQVNSTATPLGPGDVPIDMVVCHVALEYLGEIRDLFVTIDDGTVYRHTFP